MSNLPRKTPPGVSANAVTPPACHGPACREIVLIDVLRLVLHMDATLTVAAVGGAR